MASHSFEEAAGAMTCREIVECATSYLEGNVHSSIRVSIDFHVTSCIGCRAYVNQIALIGEALKLLPGPFMGSAQRNRLREAFAMRRFD